MSTFTLVDAYAPRLFHRMDGRQMRLAVSKTYYKGLCCQRRL